MKKLLFVCGSLLLITQGAFGQFMPKERVLESIDSSLYRPQSPDSTATVFTLEDALKVALSENVAVKVADKEIERTGYARKGTYAALLPQVDGSASFQRTIKKQVMYMDGDGFNFGAMIGETLASYLLPLYAQHPGLKFPDPAPADDKSSSSNEGFSVGRWNTWSAGLSASMPLVNLQLWESIRLSGKDVELAVEKARSSRLDMVSQVKQAFFAVLIAKQTKEVYEDVFANALENYKLVAMKYNAQKASELEYTRSMGTLQSSIPNLYNAESSIELALWQLKAVMGVELDSNIDVAGRLEDFAGQMFYDIHSRDSVSLDRNTTVRQLAIQAEQLAGAIRVQKAAYLPSLGLSFTYTYNAMANDFKFSEYRWSPYSFVGVSLQIPIFSGGKRLNQVKQARVQYDEFKLQQKNTERQLRIAIRQNLTTMEMSMKNYTAAQAALSTARKAYDIASKSYNVGRSTLTDLNDAQLALVQAQFNASQCIYNFLIAKTGLEQNLGVDYTVNQ